MSTHVCSYCNAEFQAASSLNRRYCSHKCSVQGRTKTVVAQVCEVCGKSFTIYPTQVLKGFGKYCSQKCFGASCQKPKIEITCGICGNTFLRLVSDTARGRAKYCSRECFYKSKKTSVVRKCLVCGKFFTVFKSTLDKGYGKVCSFDCRNKYLSIIKNKKVEETCEFCGSTFMVSNCRKTIARFCSHKCYAMSLKKTQKIIVCSVCGTSFNVLLSSTKRWCSRKCRDTFCSGEHASNWRGGSGDFRGYNWQTIKTKVLLRDNYTCQSCNSYFRLHVHHILPYRLFNGDHEVANRLDNLITLCYRCHKRVEWDTLYKLNVFACFVVAFVNLFNQRKDVTA